MLQWMFPYPCKYGWTNGMLYERGGTGLVEMIKIHCIHVQSCQYYVCIHTYIYLWPLSRLWWQTTIIPATLDAKAAASPMQGCNAWATYNALSENIVAWGLRRWLSGEGRLLVQRTRVQSRLTWLEERMPSDPPWPSYAISTLYIPKYAVIQNLKPRKASWQIVAIQACDPST